jgi:arginyl-tRNA synthetase
MVSDASVAGPGFINFRLDDAWLAQDLTERIASPKLNTPQVGAGRTVVVDYSSPNVAKRMHIGHIRSTLIGNAIYRLHQFLGWKAVGDNHIGDWGTQFGVLIVSWHKWHDEAAYALDPIAELQRIYQKFAVEVKEHPELQVQARAEVAKLQMGDEGNRALWRAFVDASLIEFDGVYERLDVKFDVTLGESHYRDVLVDLVQSLLERGIAKVIDGAVQIPFLEEDGKNLSKKPMVIQKSDGAALWGAERMVYVTDNRQILHFRQLFAAMKKMGVDADYVHVPFGMLRFADGAVASTRSGNVINLVDLLDTAVSRARSVVEQRSADLSEEERAEIAETVGLAAVRYSDLSQNPASDVQFDWDKILSLEGNTAPYLLYAYARCRSIGRKAAEQNIAPGTLVLTRPTERALALHLVRMPEILLSAANNYKPNTLCDHMYTVAAAFARFYSDCRVLGEDRAVSESRLALVEATAKVMAVGFDNLGIKPLERM